MILNIKLISLGHILTKLHDEQFSYQWWCVAKNNVTVIVTWAALIFVRARPTADNMLDLIDRRYATILSPH